MMITYDMHVHSSYSTDSQTPIRAQLTKAAACGLEGICLTDHMDYGFPADLYDGALPDGAVPFLLDIPAYQKEIQNLRGDFPTLDVLTGIELGIQTRSDILEKNKELAALPSLDYVIGSLHLSGRMDPYCKEFWQDRDPSLCIRQYLEELYDNLCVFTDMDSLGHLDYVVRYAPAGYSYQPVQYRDLLEEILNILIQKDIALEINTSGCRSTGYPNPHPYILSLYRELGGEMITIGSDAHTPEFLACQFDTISLLMKQAGLRQYLTFHQRSPHFHTLDH